jgi:hypothetical protein
MDWLLELRPIRFFSLYLAAVFFLSTWLRLRQYRAVLSLVTRMRSQWPNLTQLVLAHRHIFLTWGTLRPLVLLLALFLINTLASQFIWPQAQEFRVADLIALWPVLPVVITSGLAMVAFDAVGTFQVGQIDQAETAKYFDQAEFWLKGWKAPVVRVLSLGFVNPRQMVAREVRAALESATGWLAMTLWWVTAQTVLRILFGLSLWVGYALQDWLRAMLAIGTP